MEKIAIAGMQVDFENIVRVKLEASKMNRAFYEELMIDYPKVHNAVRVLGEELVDFINEYIEDISDASARAELSEEKGYTTDFADLSEGIDSLEKLLDLAVQNEEKEFIIQI